MCVCSCIWAWASWYMYVKHFCLGFLLKELAFWIDLTLQSINDLICLKRCFQSNILWTCMLLHVHQRRLTCVIVYYLEDFCFFCWQLKPSWHNTLTMEKGIEYKFVFCFYYMISLKFKKNPCHSTTDFFQLLDTQTPHWFQWLVGLSACLNL